jgi:hypothetical protein
MNNSFELLLLSLLILLALHHIADLYDLYYHLHYNWYFPFTAFSQPIFQDKSI